MRWLLALVSGALLALGASLALPACDSWPGLNGEGYNGGGSATAGGGTGRLEDTSGRLGSSCGTCQSGLSCVGSFPGGLCTRSCQSSADCAGGLCVLYGYDLVCMPTCTSDITCRPGYQCSQADEGQVCSPGGGSSVVDAGTD